MGLKVCGEGRRLSCAVRVLVRRLYAWGFLGARKQSEKEFGGFLV